MTKAEIKAELKLAGVAIKGNLSEEKLLAKLNDVRSNVGMEPEELTESVEVEEDTLSAPVEFSRVQMVENVKHGYGENLQTYAKGEQYEVPDDVAETFKINGWAK